MKRNGWRGEDWRVVVTGASSGIGRAAAGRLVAAGARVALWARRGDELAALAEELGEGAVAVPCDVADPAAVDEAARRSEASIGLVNGLINAAGVADPRPLAQLDPEAWRRTIAVNLSGSFYTCHAIATRLRREGEHGSIVNVGSELAAMGASSYSAYCASKFGVVGLTKALAAELAPDIRVNVLCPGPVDTPMLAGEFALADDPGQARADENQRPLMKRLGQPGEMGDAAVWLLTRPGFATGAVLPIDGGTTAV
jgi:NAD(P)-dependent dehydrogenase (short-subunit alcohol dehydrogenase family)